MMRGRFSFLSLSAPLSLSNTWSEPLSESWSRVSHNHFIIVFCHHPKVTLGAEGGASYSSTRVQECVNKVR